MKIACLYARLCLLAITVSTTNASNYNERYSYSLSTFDPDGKLDQVERAMHAASHGSPVVAIAKENYILMAAPQVLPSPFMMEDGTSRFVSITPEIMVAHSGLSADGRNVVAASQRLAIEHEYTFDDDIPIEIFMEEISLLYQEYTMKPAARPFGVSLLVGYVPKAKPTKDQQPCLFRIDPSGLITKGSCVVMNGVLERTQLANTLNDKLEQIESIDEAELVRCLNSAIEEQAVKKGMEKSLVETILTASLDNEGKFRKRRYNMNVIN
jgi:20S proteasome subunit alpha 2